MSNFLLDELNAQPDKVVGQKPKFADGKHDAKITEIEYQQNWKMNKVSITFEDLMDSTIHQEDFPLAINEADTKDDTPAWKKNESKMKKFSEFLKVMLNVDTVNNSTIAHFLTSEEQRESFINDEVGYMVTVSTFSVGDSGTHFKKLDMNSKYAIEKTGNDIVDDIAGSIDATKTKAAEEKTSSGLPWEE